MTALSRLEHHYLDASDALEEFVDLVAPAALDGAVVSFTGLARRRGSDGGVVEELRLDWRPGLTERSIQDIAEAAKARFDVGAVQVIHRCGNVLPGDVIVFAAAASPHRREAFLAADYLMDRLKSEAAFWKYERGPKGGRWIEPTEQDRATLARWSA